MVYTFADKIMDGIDDLRRGLRGWSKADHSQYFPMGCVHSDKVIALHNGSLLSVIRINGYMGQFSPELFSLLREQWKKFLRNNAADKTAKGFDLFWSYEYDPEGMVDFMLEARGNMIKAAERRGMNTRDVIEEEARLYGEICARESQFLLVVTHIDSLPKADHKKASATAVAARKNLPKGVGAAPRGLGLSALDAVHEQHVDKVSVFLANAGFGYSFQRLNAYEALYDLRHGLLPATTQKGWRAKLKIKDVPNYRATEAVRQAARDATSSKKSPPDWTFMLPPSLSDQLMPESVLDLGKYVVVDDRTYAPIFVSELASEPEPIENILRMFYQRKHPVRMVYSLMSNSDQANFWNRTFAGLFSFMSASNRQINAADKAMKAYQEANGAVLGYSLSVVTWCKTESLFDPESGKQLISTAAIQKRAQEVETFLQRWGGQQLTTTFGCAVESLMSATPGYMIPPAAPLAPQVEVDVLTQLPLMRPAALWEPNNAIWFRTEDGVLSPYQPMSSRQNTMLTLVMGGMGFGKSNLISEHIQYFANHPEVDEMPYIRGMDFGASSSGVIDIIKSSLPPEKQHQAVFEFFSNSGEMVKNMLDTRTGCRYPLADHKSFLKNWLLILCDDLIEQSGGVQNILTILDTAIDRAYEDRDDRSPKNTVPKYRPAVAERVVREQVEKHGIRVDEHTHYWEIVDDLLEVGIREKDQEAIYAAKVAQREVAPQLSHLILAVSQLKEEFRDAPLIGDLHLTAAIANALTNANKLFPCFSGKTNRDISESRVCVFDMSTVFGRDGGPGAEWNRSVFFAAAFRLLTEDLFVSVKETGRELTEQQTHMGLSEQTLRWHIRYLENQDQIMKVFWGDELHRIGKVRGAFTILDSMAYEGRKYRVGLMMGTQMPDHFPPDMRQLASSIFIFGASQSSENAQTMQKLFDLTNDERQIVEAITKPNPTKGAEVFVIHKVDTRTQRLKVHFNIGRNKLWAYATESNERKLRSILYQHGPSTAWARRTLAEKVPNLNATLKSRKDASGNEDLSELELVMGLAKELLAEQIGSKGLTHAAN